MKQELIDLATFLVRKYPIIHLNNLLETLDEYDKSINSTRRRERRADGSNSKAKKLCLYTEYCINQDKIGEYCLSDIQCDEKQSD